MGLKMDYNHHCKPATSIHRGIGSLQHTGSFSGKRIGIQEVNGKKHCAYSRQRAWRREIDFGYMGKIVDRDNGGVVGAGWVGTK